MAKVSFRIRGFITLLTASSFLISLVSGIILYFTPQGRVANWTHWTFWQLDKETWAAMHINSSLIFFLIIFFHIYNNWKTLTFYIRRKVSEVAGLKLELIVTLILSFFIVVASIYNLQPFGKIIQWNDDIKNYWANKASAEPPMPHAELLTVTEFSAKLNIPLETFQKKLSDKGWDFAENETILQIAERNQISPADLYKILITQSSGRNMASGNLQHGGGWGRKSIGDVCQSMDKNVDEALKILAAKGIQASKEDNIKDVAERYNLRPFDIVEMIQGEN